MWTFHTVPRPGEFGYDTWGGDSAKNRSGVNVWGYMSLDAERGILYMPLGAPNNDRVGIDRPGNNLFSSSVVAVDANTGKYLWHFQLVHHDIWDYDTQSAPLVVDLQRGGETIPAVLIVNKTGLLFTLNRVTGKPIFDIEERPVPKSDVPGEQASPTQPFPVKPEPLAQMTISRNNLYKGEPQHQAYCEHLVDDNNMKLGGPFMPIALNRYSISPPGPAGGINFWGPAYDPKLHLFVSNTTNIFQPMRLVLRPDGSYINSGPLAGTSPLRRSRQESAVRADAMGRTGRGQYGYGRHRVSQDARRLRHAAARHAGHGSPQFRRRHPDRKRAHVRRRHGRFQVPRVRDGNRRQAVGDQAAVIDRDDANHVHGRRWTAVRHGRGTGGGLTGSEVTNDEIIAFALPKKRYGQAARS